MAITPEELQTKTFEVVAEGYDRPAVNQYLAELAQQLYQSNTAGVAGAEISADEFDRVGTEITVMLRHAKESASKIREDAEVESQALLEKVRGDIEADRAAHEQAAAELISRTEERAAGIRTDAEQYSQETRETVDRYAEERQKEADDVLAQAAAEAEESKQNSADGLATAKAEAEAKVDEAVNLSGEIIAAAEADAKDRSEEILGQARTTLDQLIETETQTRQNLNHSHEAISTALDLPEIADLSSGLDARDDDDSGDDDDDDDS